MSTKALIDLAQMALIRTVSFVSDVAARRAQAESQYHQTMDQANTELAAAKTAATKRREQIHQDSKAACQIAIEAAEKKWQNQKDHLETQRTSRRNEIFEETEEIRRKSADQGKEATWRAESTYAAITAEAETNLRKAHHLLEEVNSRVDAIRSLTAQISANCAIKANLDHAHTTSAIPNDLADAGIERKLDSAENILLDLQGNPLSRLRRTLLNWLAPCGLLLIGLAIGWAFDFDFAGTLIGTCAGFVFGLVFVGINMKMRRRTTLAQLDLAAQLATSALESATHLHHLAQSAFESQDTKAREMRDVAQNFVRSKHDDHVEKAGPRMERRLQKLEAHFADTQQEAQSRHELRLASARDSMNQHIAEAQAEYEQSMQSSQTAWETQEIAATAALHEAMSSSQSIWSDGINSLDVILKSIDELQQDLGAHWPSWGDDVTCFNLPSTFNSNIGLGTLTMDVRQIPDFPVSDESFPWPFPHCIQLPLAADFRKRGSVIINADETRRDEALSCLQSFLIRAITSVPPAHIRLTLYDPVGLGQTFAGFMHLSDFDESALLKRIWTEPQHLENQLNEVSEHLERVIQTYLRNEYASLDEYNRAAGEIAEPYHIIALADFPEGVSDAAARRLASIMTSGPRCGVFVCIFEKSGQELPEPIRNLDWQESHLRIECDHQNQWRLTNPPLADFPVTMNTAPNDELFTEIISHVGAEADGAHEIQVPATSIMPQQNDQWTRSSKDEIAVAIGPCGATRMQELRLGRGTTQHALVAGRTGSGKSTLLHVLITNLALWYSPDELEFYLVDFKKGVEFQAYATHQLPHARVIAIESDREFALSVLRRLDEELRRRGDMFRITGVQDVSGWRETQSEPLPRTLLVVDEFQEFFANDDGVAQEASMLLDRLVRQGRAFGMHLLMGSQTLDGAFTLARSTLGQIGVRIALQCAESDSYLILNEDNPAARLLRRPGEAIYNDSGGRLEGNSPFQVAWLSDEDKDQALTQISSLPHVSGANSQFVFRGNIPSTMPQDSQLQSLLDSQWDPTLIHCPVILGDPIAISDATTLQLHPSSGCNALILGQHPESANAILLSTLLQTACMLPPTTTASSPGLMVWIFDGRPSDAVYADRLMCMANDLPHQVTRVTARNLDEEINRLTQLLHARSDGVRKDRAMVLIFGLDTHRIANLRPAEDAFAFSVDDSSTPSPNQQLAAILRDGPSVGMHSMLWFDGLNNLNRGLDRASQKECDLKILFQMSANDSGQLIDSTTASDLGPSRALLYTEARGEIEKFRPWAMPDADWTKRAAHQIYARFKGSEGG